MPDFWSANGRPMYYDFEGKPLELMDWARLNEETLWSGDRHVADHYLRGWRVSTVWLGVDMSFGFGVPLIFETMIFAPGDATDEQRAGLDLWQNRWPSRQAALDGHSETIDMLCDRLGYSRADLTEPVGLDEVIEADLNELLGRDRPL